MLFDTSILIDMFNGKRAYQYGSISIITVLEFIRGVESKEKAQRALAMLGKIFLV